MHGAASFCALWHPAGATCPSLLLDVLLHRDAFLWDRDSSVGGSATCLAALAILLSPASFSSQEMVIVPGLQEDSQGPNWLPTTCLMRVNRGCNFVAQSLLLIGCQPGFGIITLMQEALKMSNPSLWWCSTQQALDG